MKKFLLFVIGFVCVSIGMRAQDIFVTDGSTVYVHAISAGQFAQAFNKDDYTDGTRFVFCNDCVLNQDDVNAIMCCGDNNKRFYVDFFDITNNGVMTVSAIDALISDAVDDMSNSLLSQKGIFLPFNSTLGTSNVIKWNGNQYNNGSTFIEYAAYYRESETAKNLVLHVWDMMYWNGWGTVALQNYATAAQHLNSHNEIKNAETVLVSTVAETQFDLSLFTASKLVIEIECDDMVGHAGNTNIPDNANIIVKSSVAGAFAAHINTAGTKRTPTELLKISGPVICDDIEAVSEFTTEGTTNTYHGPRVLDLREVQGTEDVLAGCVSDIVNGEVEFILLPNGWNKADVNLAANTTNMPGLKAAISVSADKKDLVAYINVPGSLAEARVLYTGGTKPGEYGSTVFAPTPSYGALTNVTLSGTLNGSDLAANITTAFSINEDGHLYDVSAGKASNGAIALNQEHESIRSIDLSDAVFPTQSDMWFQAAGYEKLTNIQLPTSSAMNILTKSCMENIQTLTELCIPSNFTRIEENALYNCNHLSHIYTTASESNGENADAVDGGPNTITIASTVTDIETGAFATGCETITDVYVLARTAPKCARGAFTEGMYYGWGGLEGASAYCREKYVNNGILWTVLHFPNGCTETEKAHYTDLDRYNYYASQGRNNGYSQPDQTGDLDGDGNPLIWPLFSETRRAYNQGTSGYLWYDWTPVRDDEDHNWVEGQAKPDAFGMEDILKGNPPYDLSKLPSISVVEGAVNTTFDDYIGWHQFVLCNAGYFYDPVPVDDDTEYAMYDKWYSFCIPFDITVEEAVELMGDPKQNLLPDVRTLMNVYRFPSQNKIYLNISRNLGGDITFDASGKWASGGTDVYIDEEFQGQYGHAEGVPGLYNKDGKRILIKGGYPYLVKPYFPVGMTAPKNLGVYILAKKDFPIASVGHTETICPGTAAAIDVRAPFVNHTVQALNGDKNNDNAMNYGGKYDGTDDTKYFYTFVGHYTTQALPKYCYYLSGGQFKRYVNFSETTLATWKWNPYVTIIGVTATTEAQITNNLADINYVAAGDIYSYSDNYRIDLSTADDDRETTNAKYFFIFDDGIEGNLNGDDNETTAIELADGMVNAPVQSGKVYNMNGQLVGNSVNALNKGLYIVNGKKFVVK